MSIFSDLLTPTADYPEPGYRRFDKYPTQYQAADFPQHGHHVRLTGNNQAFFFVTGIKMDDKVIDVQTHTTALSKLVGNILKQGMSAEQRPLVRLQIDADVFENPQRFVEKYQALRPEPEQSERERLLRKEAMLISDFVNQGGVPQLVAEVVQILFPTLAIEDVQAKTEEFLEKNFRLEGVRTADALQFATWEIRSDKGIFAARQEYKNSTYMIARPIQVGISEQLALLADNQHEGAEQILFAVGHTRNLETIDLTLGGDTVAKKLAAAKPLATPGSGPEI